MKILLLASLNFLLLGSLATAGVTFTSTGVSVSGAIEGSGAEPILRGDTLDYLTFEITAAGPVGMRWTDIGSSLFLAIAQVVEVFDPGDERFLNLVGPYVVFANSPPLTRILDPGTYVIQVAESGYRSGDIGFDYLPVNRQGGGFIVAPYTFALEGQFQALDFKEGNLNGTFTTTQLVPEPGVLSLLGASAAACLSRRRRR